MLYPIPGFDRYSITSLGDVISFRRYSRGVALSPYIDKDGYACVSLRVGDKSKAFKVHRLVAVTFLETSDLSLQVNHIDGNKLNNHFTNLEWISNLDNQRHAWQTGLKQIKLSLSQVSDIKDLIKLGRSNTEIAKLYSVDQSLISNIKTGKIWNKVLTAKIK